jgi:hypothetical protein
MTLSLSSSPEPTQLDLATINAVQTVVVDSIRNQVCQWEQSAVDAAQAGDFRSAQLYKDWAIAADLVASRASSACTAIFMDALESHPLIPDQRKVELPRINRSSRDLALDVMALEVASEQPEPAGQD